MMLIPVFWFNFLSVAWRLDVRKHLKTVRDLLKSG
jgi:hypothetical protein